MAQTDTISRIAEMTMLTLRMPRKLMLRSWWKISMDVRRVSMAARYLKAASDPQRLQFLAAAVDQCGDRVGHGHRGEQRGRNTDEQCDAEALDRARAHGDQAQRRQQVGDVGVQ